MLLPILEQILYLTKIKGFHLFLSDFLPWHVKITSFYWFQRHV